MIIDRVPMNLQLMEPCWSCRTESVYGGISEQKPTVLEEDGVTCSICHGLGGHLTDLGTELVDLLDTMGVVMTRKPK